MIAEYTIKKHIEKHDDKKTITDIIFSIRYRVPN